MRFIHRMKIGLFLACVPVFGAGCASLSPKLNVLPSIARHRSDSQYQAAREAEKRGQLQKARELYAALQRQSPNSPEYAHRMGVVCVQLGDHATAMKYFEHARGLDARNPALLADMGYSVYLQRDYTGAEALLRESVLLSPGDPRAVNNLAMAIGHQGRYDESLAVFRQVNSETQSLLNVAFLQSQRDDHDAAIATYQRILSQEPTNKLASRALQELNAAHPRQQVAAMPNNDLNSTVANGSVPPASVQPAEQRPAGQQQSTELRNQSAELQESPTSDWGDQPPSGLPPSGLPPSPPPLVITSADDIPASNDRFAPPVIIPNDGPLAVTPVPPQPVDNAAAVSDNASAVSGEEGFELPLTRDPPRELASEAVEAPTAPPTAPITPTTPTAPPAMPAADELSNVFEGDDNAPETPMKDSGELTGLEWAQDGLAEDRAAVEAGKKASTGDDCLRGFCPVALRDERRLAPVVDEFSTEYQAQVLRFSSAEARDRFLEHPDWYVPAAGGLDVIEVKQGRAVTQGSLDFACWFRHRLHLFSSAENLAAFRATPRDFIANP